MNNESKIEAILFFKNEPVAMDELARILDTNSTEVSNAIESLQELYKERGIVLLTDGVSVTFGTNSKLTDLIESVQKEDFSKELGRSGIETLSIILYKGPVSRREIDYIRGVNSGHTIRTLLVRGLIERAEDQEGGRSYSYKPTLKLFEHLGITKRTDLPEYDVTLAKMQEFASTAEGQSEQEIK